MISDYTFATDIPFGLNAQYPGDVNQALIELGSTICKVSDPKCDSCPLQKHCSAYEKVNKPDKHKVATLSLLCGCLMPF